jgi:hypothetical protein
VWGLGVGLGCVDSDEVECGWIKIREMGSRVELTATLQKPIAIPEQTRPATTCEISVTFSSSVSSFSLSSLELSNTKVYAPYIRALLGTASYFCRVVVLNCTVD